MWREFWDEFVPEATRGGPYAVLVNGDAMDGSHHRSVTQISQNPIDQIRIARKILEPIVAKSVRYYHIRGTEAHVGPSAHREEELAESLGAVPNSEGQHARYDLWLRMKAGRLIHALHHIGTTGSQAYEATAVHKELIESYAEAARWGREPPDCIIRSHRHRCIIDQIPTRHEKGIAAVTPAWQGQTPYTWRLPGARLATPQFGGIVVRVSDEDELYARPCVWTVDRSKVEE